MKVFHREEAVGEVGLSKVEANAGRDISDEFGGRITPTYVVLNESGFAKD